MSTSEDFGALWKQQKIASLPDITEIKKQVTKVQNRTRKKLLIKVVGTMLGFAYYIFYIFYFQPKLTTTKIGTLLMLIAILFYQAVSVSIIVMLSKGNANYSTKEYLNMMIQLKQKQELLNKRVLNITYSTLVIGLLLYTSEFSIYVSTTWLLVLYAFVIACLLLIWVYIRPLKLKKDANELNDAIYKLESVNKQID